MDNDIHVGAVIVGGRLGQDFATGFQLVKNLFEPELVGLMDDDEKHLVMRMELALDKANRRLKREELFDRKIIAVVSRLLRSAEWTFHDGSVGTGATGDKRDSSCGMRDARLRARRSCS